jgi:hypothetical protein
MGSQPYVYNDHHVPSTPQTPPLTPPWPSHLLYGFILQHPRRETTRRVHRSHASSTPTAPQHHRWQPFRFPRSTIALAADPPGSSEPVLRTACMSPRHVCTSTVVCGSPVVHVVAGGVRAERHGVAVWRCSDSMLHRVAGGMHSGGTDTLRVHKEAYVLPRATPSFLARPCRSAGVPLVLMPLFVRLDTLHE